MPDISSLVLFIIFCILIYRCRRGYTAPNDDSLNPWTMGISIMSAGALLLNPNSSAQSAAFLGFIYGTITSSYEDFKDVWEEDFLEKAIFFFKESFLTMLSFTLLFGIASFFMGVDRSGSWLFLFLAMLASLHIGRIFVSELINDANKEENDNNVSGDKPITFKTYNQKMILTPLFLIGVYSWTVNNDIISAPVTDLSIGHLTSSATIISFLAGIMLDAFCGLVLEA